METVSLVDAKHEFCIDRGKTEKHRRIKRVCTGTNADTASGWKALVLGNGFCSAGILGSTG